MGRLAITLLQKGQHLMVCGITQAYDLNLRHRAFLVTSSSYGIRGIGSRPVLPRRHTSRCYLEACTFVIAAPPTTIFCIVARGLPFMCDARVHRPSTRDHMSASYCGPDCASCSARSTVGRNQGRKHARAQNIRMKVARGIFEEVDRCRHRHCSL